VNTGALLNRLNYSLALAGNKVRGVSQRCPSLLGMDPPPMQRSRGPRGATFPWRANGSDDRRDAGEELDSPQILQAKLDDPVKHVDLEWSQASCWAHRNFSGDSGRSVPRARTSRSDLAMNDRCCEGARLLKFSRRYF